MPRLCSLLLLQLIIPFFLTWCPRSDGGPIQYLGGRKHYKSADNDPQLIGGVEHEHSFGLVTGQAYHGTQATFSVWDPYVEMDDEFSLAQLWVLALNPDGTLSSLEAGWQVFQGLYGDNNPRLFVFWTKDSYQNTGCYNLNCAGYVQTSQNLVPGETVLSPVSTTNGFQYTITLGVFKDSGTGDWLLYANDEQVGYWPQNLSPLTANHATELQWGGEIINLEQNGQHTTTQMGSGQFANAGYKLAAYIRNLQWVDAQNNLQSVDFVDLQTISENVTCYNIEASNDTTWGTYFFFGGPGRNPNCP